jgi:hypothetical protein
VKGYFLNKSDIALIKFNLFEILEEKIVLKELILIGFIKVINLSNYRIILGL